MRLALLETALRSLGERETPGPVASPSVLGWLRRWLPRTADDSTPWCGAWLGVQCELTGAPVPDKCFRAASWVRWGRTRVPLTARPGDVAILTRPGGHHVGLVLRMTRESVWLLGGNQGNAVSVREYPAARVECVRSID